MKQSRRRHWAPEADRARRPTPERRARVVLVECRTCGDRAAYANLQEASAPCVLCGYPVVVVGQTSRVRQAVAWVFCSIPLADN